MKETETFLADNMEILTDPYRVWNLDERAFSLNPKRGLVISEKGKHAFFTLGNSDKENLTNLIAVNAVGDFGLPLTIYKCERLLRCLRKDCTKTVGPRQVENKLDDS